MPKFLSRKEIFVGRQELVFICGTLSGTSTVKVGERSKYSSKLLPGTSTTKINIPPNFSNDENFVRGKYLPPNISSTENFSQDPTNCRGKLRGQKYLPLKLSPR